MKDTFIKLPKSKQQVIYKAALKEFAKKGYYQANVADISKRAGISAGALYTYFENKEVLYLSLAEYVIEQMVKNLYEKYTSINGSYFEILENLLHGTVVFAKKYKDILAVYLELGCVYQNKFAKSLSDKVESAAKIFHVEMIEKAKERGEINASINSDIAAYTVDNNLTFLAYSVNSEYYNQRFKSYFGINKQEVNTKQKISLIMELLRQYFK